MRADFQTEKISCYELIMEENEDYVSDCSGERLVININTVRWDGRTKHCMLEFNS